MGPLWYFDNSKQTMIVLVEKLFLGNKMFLAFEVSLLAHNTPWWEHVYRCGPATLLDLWTISVFLPPISHQSSDHVCQYSPKFKDLQFLIIFCDPWLNEKHDSCPVIRRISSFKFFLSTHLKLELIGWISGQHHFDLS